MPPALRAGFDFCYFDLDTGPLGTMQERLEACGIDTNTPEGGFFKHGRPPGPDHQLSVRGSLCDNIKTEEYMRIERGKGGKGDCFTVTGLKEGRGSDNPQRFSDVMMGDYDKAPGRCAQYDTCPASGVSGYERPPGRIADIIECGRGGDAEFRYAEAAGIYPEGHAKAVSPHSTHAPSSHAHEETFTTCPVTSHRLVTRSATPCQSSSASSTPRASSTLR